MQDAVRVSLRCWLKAGTYIETNHIVKLASLAFLKKFLSGASLICLAKVSPTESEVADVAFIRYLEIGQRAQCLPFSSRMSDLPYEER